MLKSIDKKKIIQLIAVAVLIATAFLVGRTTKETSTEAVTSGYIKLEECIPLEDVSCYFINGYDYPCFELKDYGNQLDNPENRSYKDIMSTLDDVTEEYKKNNIIN